MLEILELNYFFDKKPVLKNINIEVTNNDFVGLIGPNGAGKSTLLKCITGYLQNYSGKIFISAKALQDIEPKERARMIAVVVQQPQFEFDFTVRDMVLMGKFPYLEFWENYTSQQERETDKLLEKLNIEHIADRHLSELSGGEFQMVMIARALNQNTPILLFDEPASHLDIHHQIEIFQLLKKLNQEEHKTIIAVSHNINLAAEFCDKIIILNNGELVNFDSTDQALTQQAMKNIFSVPIEVVKNPFTGKPNVLYNYSPEKDEK
ncbi:MAG TPA: ABC transporter ATP-binding protein [Candidatus Cloacimonetes bacterium]|nr:ABC transporter ATP-binding protein [Candidatus Cloacimonadota bacterium]HEX37695.1 ABC transporter ATP-binding protein [Candidatus Cloacimonadota bacterium]